MGTDDGEEVIPFQELTCCLIPGRQSRIRDRSSCRNIRDTHVKKYEQPLTWLWMKLSVIFSCPKSSTGSAHRISHIRPCVGGSRNRSICIRARYINNEAADTDRKTTNGADVVQSIEFRREAAVDAEELLVHDSSERQCAERVHASIIYSFRIFVFAFGRDGVIFSQGT